jgi:hypothetical protein
MTPEQIVLSNQLTAKIKVLNELIWEYRCNQPQIDAWLNNFDGSSATVGEERVAALHAISHLTYYGLPEIRELLIALFRDHVRQPLVQAIRAANPGFTTVADLAPAVQKDLQETRFLGMGNPSESGTHLLYYFRQENDLTKDLSINSQQLFTRSVRSPEVKLKYANVKRYVFLDDLCGSGQQSVQYTETLLQDLRDVARHEGQEIEIIYLVLFGSSVGLQHARDNSDFDRVEAVCEFDSSFKTFGNNSRCFNPCPSEVDRDLSLTIFEDYGKSLVPDHPLGYKDGQLLLAFHHNVPDNTLPVVWSSGKPSAPWIPLLKRAGKF